MSNWHKQGNKTLVTFATYSLRPGSASLTWESGCTLGSLTQHSRLGPAAARTVTSGDALRPARPAACSLRHRRTVGPVTRCPRSTTHCQPLSHLLSCSSLSGKGTHAWELFFSPCWSQWFLPGLRPQSLPRVFIKQDISKLCTI